MQVGCPHCGAFVSLPEGMGGKPVHCTSCGGAFRAPDTAAAAVSRPAPVRQAPRPGIQPQWGPPPLQALVPMRPARAGGTVLAVIFAAALIVLPVVPSHVAASGGYRSSGGMRAYWTWSTLLDSDREYRLSGEISGRLRTVLWMKLVTPLLAGGVLFLGLLGRSRVRGACFLLSGAAIGVLQMLALQFSQMGSLYARPMGPVAAFSDPSGGMAMVVLLASMTAGGQLVATQWRGRPLCRIAPVAPAAVAGLVLLTVLARIVVVAWQFAPSDGSWSSSVPPASVALLAIGGLGLLVMSAGGIHALVSGLRRGPGMPAVGAALSILGLALLLIAQASWIMMMIADSDQSNLAALNILLSLLREMLPAAAAILFVMIGYRMIWQGAVQDGEPAAMGAAGRAV